MRAWVVALLILIGTVRPGTSAPAPCRLERAFVGDAAGLPQDAFYGPEGAFFYARVAGTSGGTLWVIVLDAAGVEVARLGGAFTAGALDLPRGCGADAPNGLVLEPGRYRARFFLDGRRSKELPFRVCALEGSGRVATVEAHVEDATGRRREVFRPADGGVYARVSMVNLTRDVAHEHVLRVGFSGPSGVVGRPLGGLLRVPVGTRLDGVDLPSSCDPEGHAGMRLAGLAPGQYTMTVTVDGTVWARIPFQIVSK